MRKDESCEYAASIRSVEAINDKMEASVDGEWMTSSGDAHVYVKRIQKPSSPLLGNYGSSAGMQNLDRDGVPSFEDLYRTFKTFVAVWN